MKDDWGKCLLDDVCLRIYSGGTPSTRHPEYWGGSFNWLSSGETNQRFIYDTERKITQEGIDESSTKLAPKGCTVIASAGQGHTRGQASFLMVDTYMNQSVIACQPNCDLILPLFLYYNLDSRYEEFRLLSDGTSTRGGLSGWILKKMEILLPPIEEQTQICDILFCLDKKIENNMRINQNLEQQAMALFKSWFINFDIFNGVKPKEWEFCLLGEVTNMCAGGDKPKAVASVKSETLQYPIYSNGLEKDGLYGYTDVPKINEESVTVSARGTIGFVCLRHVPYVPIVRLIALVPNSDYLSAKYLYLYLKQLNITGTGTTQQQLTVPDFKKTEILVPDKNTMSKFTEIVSPLFDEIWANENESQHLAQIRNVLLPQLMSGELDVSNLDIRADKS